MKILRRHRGFTTNSSSASEWIDPERPPESIPLNQFDLDGNLIVPPTPTPSSSSGDGGPATISLDGFVLPPPPSKTTGTSTNATPTPEATPDARPSIASENTTMILGFLGAVLGVFALERMLRRWWRSRQEED